MSRPLGHSGRLAKSTFCRDLPDNLRAANLSEIRLSIHWQRADDQSRQPTQLEFVLVFSRPICAATHPANCVGAFSSCRILASSVLDPPPFGALEIEISLALTHSPKKKIMLSGFIFSPLRPLILFHVYFLSIFSTGIGEF